jgi:hypothetical protein
MLNPNFTIGRNDLKLEAITAALVFNWDGLNRYDLHPIYNEDVQQVLHRYGDKVVAVIRIKRKTVK